MTRSLFLLLLFVAMGSLAKGQCNSPEFEILNASNLCRNSPIRLVNEGEESLNYYWDLCPESFTEIPETEIRTLAGFAQGYGYRLVQDDGLWYGFMVSRSLDKLFRLDFGPDPQNTPQINDLGNPGGLMDAPESIDLIKDNQKWYGFVGKGENSTGQVVKLQFGEALTNMPAATGYGTFGAGNVRIRDLSIVRQGDDIILLLLQYNNSAFNRINFGNSLENAPGASSVVSIPGASLTRSFDLAGTCDALRAHLVCENGLVMQVSFGNDITGPVSVEGSFNFASVVQPWKIRTIANADRHIAFISNNNRKFSIVDFGDLSLSSTPVEIANGNDSRLIGIEVIKYNGKTLLQGGTSGGTHISVAYQNSCGLQQDFSYEREPAPFGYPSSGTRRIGLFTLDNTGVEFVASHAVEVMDAEAPSLTIEYEGVCQNNDVVFSSPGSDAIVSWSWDFGNASTSGDPSPTTSYAAPGTYAVVLDALGTNGCVSGDLREIRIFSPPVPDFEMPASLICTNNEFIFSSTTPDQYEGFLSYHWFVDDVDVGNSRDLYYSFSSTGSKEIKLVTAIPGCSDEVAKTTTPVQPGPVVDFSYTGTCEGETFSFQNDISGSVESFSWDFSNGLTSSDPNPTTAFEDFGDYGVSLTATTAAGCENVRMKIVHVRSNPLVDFAFEAAPNGCSGSETIFENRTFNPDGRTVSEWLWNFNDPADGTAGTGMDGQHVFKEAGDYSVSLAATTVDGCSASTTIPTTIRQTPSTAFTHSSICEDQPVSFVLPGSDVSSSYWEIGTAYYLVNSPTHTFPAPGDYPLYLEVVGTNGCLATWQQTIHVPVPLTPDFSVDKSCVGEPSTFTDLTSAAEEITAQSWRFNGNETLAGSPVAYAFTQPGTATVNLEVTTQSGCSYEITRTLEVGEPPEAQFSAAPSSGAYPLEVTFTNSSSGAAESYWEFGDGTANTSTAESPVHVFAEQGTYTVTLTISSAQGCRDSFSGTVTTVAPLPDVDIDLINITANPDGSSKLIVTIHNKGNTVLKQLPIEINFDGALALRQTIQEVIPPATKYNFVLNSAVVDIRLQYICVTLGLDGDLSPEGNQKCEQFTDNLLVFPAFPNPTMGTLNVEWITEQPKPVQITLTDRLGRQIFHKEVESLSGFNYHQMDLSLVGQGVYILTIDDGGSKSTQRIVLIGTP